MKKVLDFCFDKWWRPIIFCVLSFGLYAFGLLTKYPMIQYISFFLFGLGLLGLLVSTVYQLAKKRWLFAIITSVIFGFVLAGFLFYSMVMFFKIQSEPDRYADNLKIPTNIQINEPLGQTEPGRINHTDFYLYNDSQPGRYKYAFWTRHIEKGTIYFKAFEITKNDPLSTNRLPEMSSLIIFNPSDSIMKFSSATEFAIYEGDWGKPYAARFELWFKPDNGGQDRKLLEKNYKIEGWMR